MLLNQDYNKVAHMLLSKEFEGLHDDGFEGSINERNIFREVFFGNDNSRNSKRCLVTGVINFEGGQRNKTDTAFCSNSDSSVLTSQEDNCNIKEKSRRYSGPGCFTEGSASLTRNDHNVNAKRLKVSVNELSNPNSHLGEFMKSPAALKGIDASMSQPSSHSVSHIVTCRLVESSIQGITSSSYLLKRQTDMERGGDTGHPDVSNNGKSSLAGVDSKEGIGCKAIASPVSQESSATKLLAASPPANAIANKRWRSSNFLEVDVTEMSLNRDLVKDDLSLLRHHINHLLVAAGWRVGKRIRTDMRNGENVFRSPEGRPIREFRRAWILCGQTLFTDLNIVVQETDGKQWTDITQFLSDLSETLTEIKEELSCLETYSLVHCYCLLDPFAHIVFIDKKVKALKAGNVIKANRCLRFDNYREHDAVLGMKNADSIGYQFAERNVAHELCESSLVTGSSEGNCCNHNNNSGRVSSTSFGGLLGGNFEAHKGALTNLSEENYLSPVDTDNGTCSPRAKTFRSKTRCTDLDTLPACGSDSNCDQCGSSICEARHISENTAIMLGGSKNDCRNQDNNTSSLSCHKHSYDCDEERILEIRKDTSVGSSKHEYGASEKKFGKVGNQLLNISSNTTFGVDVHLRKKSNKKPKRISEIKLTTLYQNDRLGMYAKLDGVDNSNDHQKSLVNAGSEKSCETSTPSPDQLQSEKEQLDKKFDLKSGTFNFENHIDGAEPPVHNDAQGSQSRRRTSKKEKHEIQEDNGQKRSSICQIKDDDLLISAVIRNKNFSSTVNLSIPEKSFSRSKAPQKRKGHKGSCRLLPRSLGKGGKSILGGRQFVPRTVLSWLIDSEVLAVNDVIQFLSLKGGVVVKDGLILWDGILCNCCNKVLSLAEFKIHAGYRSNRPCMNIFLKTGKSFTLCELEAWSAEYKARKSAILTVQNDDIDQNDDSCGLCGDGGELICCDNCPSTFHQACLYAQELPEGSWYCAKCTCQICGDVVHDKEEASNSCGGFRCLQCQLKYHRACNKGQGINEGLSHDQWFCGQSCMEVYVGLQSRIGVLSSLPDGFSWSLLRCIHGDHIVHSDQRLVALKAECNSKLAVALKIMEECFVSMVDPRTGINMIPHVLYNWGSTYARLDYHDFYTIVLEKSDVLLCVAAIRIHGATIAEMPLIATCSRYRRQGLCRRLMNCIQEMLKSLKVEKLVLSAIPELVETWTVGFGFQPLEHDEKQSMSNFNMMVFPGTVWLKKPLYQNQATDQQTGGADDPTGRSACSPIDEPAPRDDIHLGVEIEAEPHLRLAECKSLRESEDEGSYLDNQLIQADDDNNLKLVEVQYANVEISNLPIEPRHSLKDGPFDLNDERTSSPDNQLHNVPVL